MRRDEVWDEDRWEAFLLENDRRINHLLEVFHSFLAKDPLPEQSDSPARERWRDRFRAYFAARGAQIDDSLITYLLHDEGQLSVEPFGLWEGDVAEEGWEDEAQSDLSELQLVPAFSQAYRLISDVLDWANGLPGDVKDSTLVQYCAYITQIGSHLVKGHLIGYEHDTLGGNIACVKRSLHAANAGLAILPELRDEPYMDPEMYRYLYEQTYEVRNQIALYVLELREQFNLGID
jgi:hypothetical protein